MTIKEKGDNVNLPIEIEMIASTLEVLSFYGILVILNIENSLSHSKIKLFAYIIISSLVASVLSSLNLPYYFIWIVSIYIILMKIFLKRPFCEIAVDVISANACFFAIEFLCTVLFSMFHKNILENRPILFGCLILIWIAIALLNKWKRFLIKIRRAYLANRSAISFIAINSFFSVTVLLNIWNNFAHLFWTEKWNLLGLIICNYLMNIGFIMVDRKQKHTKAESDAYKAYGEYLKTVSEELRSQRHEFNNQLQTIIGLAITVPNSECSQQIIQYCDQLIQNRENKTEKSPLFGSDLIIEAIIYSRIRSAVERGICFHHKIFDPLSEVKILSYELSELLNNLLNNAFEAVNELSVEERVVNLVITAHKIEVLNYVSVDFDEKSICLFDKMGYSTKGECRGYGLANVKDIAEKYNGTLKVNRDGKILCVEILFQ